MSEADSTKRLIASLTEDLERVRPLPRLRTAFAIILSVWAMFLGLVLWGSEASHGVSSLLGDRLYLASFIGLMVAAVGSTVSALAAGVPGRDRLERGGMWVALGGLSSAALACLAAMRFVSGPALASPPGLDAMCFREAALLSLLPAGVILSFLVRGWASHPIRAALVALLGAGALGTAIVHLDCGFLGPKHVLLGHLSVPVVLAVLGLYPLSVLLRRLRG